MASTASAMAWHNRQGQQNLPENIVYVYIVYIYRKYNLKYIPENIPTWVARSVPDHRMCQTIECQIKECLLYIQCIVVKL